MALCVDCDPTPEPDSISVFGYPNLPLECEISQEIGTHLVARADGKPLKAETVDAMADFCRFHLEPYFLRCEKSCDDEDLSETSPRRLEHRQKVMEEITPRSGASILHSGKSSRLKGQRPSLVVTSSTPSRKRVLDLSVWD
jgi:hypothetical protein